MREAAYTVLWGAPSNGRPYREHIRYGAVTDSPDYAPGEFSPKVVWERLMVDAADPIVPCGHVCSSRAPLACRRPLARGPLHP